MAALSSSSDSLNFSNLGNPLSLPASILATLNGALTPRSSSNFINEAQSQGSRPSIPSITSLRGYSSPRPPSPPRTYIESPRLTTPTSVVPISALPVSNRPPSRPLSPIRLSSAGTPVVTPVVTPIGTPVVTPIVIPSPPSTVITPSSPVASLGSTKTVSMGSLVPMATPRQEANLSMPLQIESEGNLVPENSIEHMLAKHQYIVTAKILVEGEHGTEARYLEAINPRGKKVFIELDEAGFIAVSPDDLTLHEGKPATTIPYSVKVGALECAAMDVCGIAFVCDNGICTLSPDVVTQNKPVETNFIYTETPVVDVKSDGAARLTDRITPYPIVRLSEIKKKPKEALNNVDEVTKRIRNTAYTGCLKDLKGTEVASHELHHAFMEFQKVQMDASTRLTESIRELEKVNDEYIRSPPTNDVTIAKYHQLIYNMRKRHEMAVDLLYTCQQVNKIRDDMLRLKGQLNEATVFIKNEFKNVNYVLPE